MYRKIAQFRLSPFSSQGFSYVYDELGNRWQQNLTTGSGVTSSLTFSNYSSPTTNGNCYHAAGRTNQPDGYCFDAAGNLLTDGIHSYTYDAENRLISVDGGQTAIYIYDGDGKRIRKVSSAGTADYLYDLKNQPITELSGSGGWNRGEVYAGSRHLATYRNGTTYFNQQNWLGTERSRLALNGSQCENITGMPFGDGQATARSCGDPSPNHFTGKERDPETGLDMFGARYYGSSLGRFMTPDWAAKATAVPYADFGDPQSLNLYSYVRNNPLAKIDPDGHCPADDGCSGVKVSVTVDGQPQMMQDVKLGPNTYFSGVGGTLSIKFSDSKDNPITGMPVKESNTSSGGKTTQNPNAVNTSDKGTISDVVGKGFTESKPTQTAEDMKQGQQALTTTPVNSTQARRH